MTHIATHIAVVDGQPTTTTQDIADVYGKRHDAVLRIVRQRMAEAGEWCLHNFVEASIEVAQPNGGTASYPVIRMTRKGFHFVVGKFTGAKAVQHQIAFADEFERMEAALRAPALPAPVKPAPLGGGLKAAIADAVKEAVAVQALPALAPAPSIPVIPPGKIMVDVRKLASIWVDLAKIRRRIDGLGILESDLPPSWWQENAVAD